ncbi:chemotaxis protein CheD [Priestia filamentosa]|uniref:chemotaxis protein CheD n=1 Tax=Priestia filamentosa TaxID=1402861 RepID=UPI0006889611|nr:chemotaxis protein CheD [Priestia filamentosa]
MGFVRAPSCIYTVGLGSCVGVVIYDKKKMAAMAHVMLPYAEKSGGGNFNRAKYADTAVYALCETLLQNGGKLGNFRAKIAGGAQMFQQYSTEQDMRIGPRNIEALKRFLQEANVPLLSKEVEGRRGRTIKFDPVSEVLFIRSANTNVREI